LNVKPAILVAVASVLLALPAFAALDPRDFTLRQSDVPAGFELDSPNTIAAGASVEPGRE
jgi:hypothetical protein